MEISTFKPAYLDYDVVSGYTLNAFLKEEYKNNKLVYTFKYVRLDHSPSYDYIVSQLINATYSTVSVTAITLNYLLTIHEEVLEPEKVKEYQQDYKELQEYRAACKAEAKRAIEYIKENQIGPAWKDL